MKKLRSLRGKILYLCLGIVMAAIIVFAAIGIAELNLLLKASDASSVSQNKVIKEESENLMWEVLVYEVLLTIDFAAEETDEQFSDLLYNLEILGEQVKDVYTHPDQYAEAGLNPPVKTNGDECVPQLLFAEWADQTDEKNLSIARKLTNLAPMMGKIVEGDYGFTLNCYIALPCGITIAYDNLPNDKLGADGKPLYYDATKCEWYQGAVATGKPYIPQLSKSFFHDMTGLSYGIPVYVDGELIAVLHGFTTIETLQERVSGITDTASDFTILVSDEGQIVYSTYPSEELTVSDNIQNVNPEIKQLLDEALSLDNDYNLVTIEGENYYASYAPIKTLGWSQIMFIHQNDLEYVSRGLLDRMDEVREEVYRSYADRFRTAFFVILGAMIALIVGAVLLSVFFSKKLVEPVDVMTKRVKSMTGDNMNFEMESIYNTGDEIEVLAGSFNTLTDTLKNYISEITTMSAEKERFATEMAMANKIQSSMLPGNFPAFPDRHEFDLYADMIPAKEVGGDLYDFYFIDDDHLVMVIGDVSGKGITAALFMVMAKQVIKSEIFLHGGDVVSAIESVNATLCEKNDARMFITVWLGVLTVSTGHVDYVNAGHEFPIVYRNGGEFQVYKDKHATPVACRKRFKVELNEIDLEPGDALYLYTDGITEANNENMEMFGRTRLEEVLNENKAADMKTLDEAVRAKISSFTGDAEQFDDMTTLCIRYNSLV